MPEDTHHPFAGPADEAYARVLPDAEGLRPDELSLLNVDLVTVASSAYARAKLLQPFRPQMLALGGFDVRCLDRLEDYAMACWFVCTTDLVMSEGPGTAELEEEVRKLREDLLLWCPPLIASGCIGETAVDLIRKGAGTLDLASDLVRLAALFRSRWEDLRGKCGVTEEELERAEKLGEKLFVAMSRRDTARRAAAAERKLKVRRFWTLLDRAYDECRRAVTFLRWREGDVDKLVPSLRHKGGGRPPGRRTVVGAQSEAVGEEERAPRPVP